MTPVTAWELEADRRRELAQHREVARQSLLSDRRDGPEASDRRLFHGWRLSIRPTLGHDAGQ